MLDKLKNSNFWVALIGAVCYQLAPMLQDGGKVDLGSVISVVLVALAGKLADPPGVKKDANQTPPQ